MQELLSGGLAMHQAGQLRAAAQLYQQILARQADHADALHLLGVLHHQQGCMEKALRQSLGHDFLLLRRFHVGELGD